MGIFLLFFLGFNSALLEKILNKNITITTFWFLGLIEWSQCCDDWYNWSGFNSFSYDVQKVS